MSSLTISQIVVGLKADGFSAGKIEFNGDPIGCYITRNDPQNRTVYASRIYRPVTIEVTGRTKPLMIGKVAKAMEVAMKKGEWPQPVRKKGQSDEQ